MVPRHAGCFRRPVSKRGKQRKEAARRAALRSAAAATAPKPLIPPPSAFGSERPRPRPRAAAQSPGPRNWPLLWSIAGVAAAAALGVVVAQTLSGPNDPLAQIASPTVEVGVPGGEVIPQATAAVSPQPPPEATGTPAPTADLTPAPAATPAPTPVMTPAPQPTPAPTPAHQPPTATPEPTAVVVALGQPDDAVAAFYREAAAGNFDAAYALWSGRMKATYPRDENLDGRFAKTELVSFDALHTVERTATSATVQANFTESYEGGGSRQFIGYWRLILVEGRWVLDEPHY